MPILDLMVEKAFIKNPYFNCRIGAGDVQLDTKNFIFSCPPLI
jgi:hypothetical protein